MKLVLTKKTLPHPQCVRVDWSPEDRAVSWVSLFWGPTEEQKQKGWSEDPDDQRTILAEFLAVCIPQDSHSYAILTTPFDKEYAQILADLRKTGLPSITGDSLCPKRVVRNPLERKRGGYIYVANLSSGQAYPLVREVCWLDNNPLHIRSFIQTRPGMGARTRVFARPDVEERVSNSSRTVCNETFRSLDRSHRPGDSS